MNASKASLLVIPCAAVMAFAGEARAQASQTQTVDANISSALELTIDAPFSPNPWILSIPANPNANSSLVLRARANVQRVRA